MSNKIHSFTETWEDIDSETQFTLATVDRDTGRSLSISAHSKSDPSTIDLFFDGLEDYIKKKLIDFENEGLEGL